MGRLLVLLFAVLAATLFVVPVTAFLCPSLNKRSIGACSTTSLSLSNNQNNRRDVFPKSRTDIRNFLTQRSIQSFVYLLNQCREDHTVRWLEKTLDFTSIDNFHGTGAFNQTRFPEWDSVFLECVDKPEESVVLQMRSRRRQHKLSGHNAYFESLGKKKPTESQEEPADEKAASNESSKPTAFSTSNYLDAIKSTTTNLTVSSSATTSSTTSGTTPVAAPKKPKTSSKKLSSASNYLDNLSKPARAKPKWSPNNSNKKKDEAKEGVAKKSSNETKKKDVLAKKKQQESKSTSRRAFASSRYLDNLSVVTNATTSNTGSSKQSTEESKNPYLEEKTKEYELSIDPPALVRRILSVRELISKEWVEDLDMLIKLNDEITESIEEYNNKVAAKNEDEDDSEEENLKVDNKDKNEKEDEDETDDEKKSDIDALLKALIKDSKPEVSPSSLKKSLEKSSKEKDGEQGLKVFDRSILNTWSQSLWSPKRSSSPYRKANFDLLLLLATQESIHRVLNNYKNDDSVRPQTHEWLWDFYIDNVNDYFDGHQTYARSEDFLKEMFQSPHTLIDTNNGILAWIDPAIVAEDIVRERSDVILDWIKVAKNILEEHTDLRRLLFTNMVSKTFSDESPLPDTIITAVDVSTIQQDEEDSASSPTEVFGAFE